MSRGKYSYPSRYNPHRLTICGRWEITVRDKKGRVRKWRTGLPWNVAQKAARFARSANYRDVSVQRMSPGR